MSAISPFLLSGAPKAQRLGETPAFSGVTSERRGSPRRSFCLKRRAWRVTGGESTEPDGPELHWPPGLSQRKKAKPARNAELR